MALKLKLRPHERVIIAGASVVNGAGVSTLVIENKVPVLREKDILKQDDAVTPARRIYFAVQLMYLDGENLADHHRLYWDLVNGFLKAAPSALGIVGAMSEEILAGRYYNALKLARRLIVHERRIMA